MVLMGLPGDYNCFDYKFFNITPKEAELMDPHQRVVLEEAWKAIIDAGYTEESIYGTNTGVYIGYTNDFRFNYWKMVNDIEPLSYSMAVAPNLSSIIPSRLSYVFNLKGPSMLIDTACSSSLVAIHTACEELKNNICDMAITGGARINLMPVSNKNRNIGIESPDFSLYAFDENANGTVWGEGVVIFVLRRLKDAQKNNEHIYGIIKGSATNQDGMSAGITAPNPQAQIDVLRKAWENAKIRPEDMAYIECHGTGTNMGDPIEVDSIDKAFQKYTNKKQFCGIGSVKSMIGHLDAVSGAAGLLKILLSMQYGQLPGNINLRIPNNAITFEDSPVYYLKENQKWEKEGRKRIAGVSAFGFSGTNCHMVIEAKDNDFHSNINYREQEYLFVLSAKTKNALWNLLYEYNNFLQFNITPPLINICYTLCKARPHYDERIAFVVKNLSELKQEISCFIRPIEDMRGDVAFFTQPNINSSAGRAFSNRRNKMFAAWEKGFDEFKKSEYYAERAEAARHTAAGTKPTDKGFIDRRIKEAEKTIRAQKKNLESYCKMLKQMEAGKIYKPKLGKLFIKQDMPKAPEVAFKIYSDEEIKRLNYYIVNMEEQVARALILHQMLGGRISDTLTLRTDCLYQENGHYIVRMYQVKTSYYEKPIPDDVAKLIQKSIEYTYERYGETEYVFVNESNPSLPFQYSMLKHRVYTLIHENDICKDNGERMGFATHLFRHCYGMKLVELHLDDAAIAHLLGHRGVNTVYRYRRASGKLLVKETEELRKTMDEILSEIIKEWDGYEQVFKNG